MASSAGLFETNTASPNDVAHSNSSIVMPTYSCKMPDYSIGGDIANFFSGNRSKQEANYQQGLDNTAIQRRMGDLKQAGINPVLAAQGQGAATNAYANGSNSGEHSASKAALNLGKSVVAAMTALKLFKILSLFV